MSRVDARIVLAGAVALGLGVVGPGWFRDETVQAAPWSPSPVVEAPTASEPLVWQQQWQSLLRREDQLGRDQRQVQEIAPRLQPDLVDRLQQGLELTRQRLAQERQQLSRQQPPEANPAVEMTAEPTASSPLPGAPVPSAWPGG